MNPLLRSFRGKRVFVTGHTGFKGSWLCEWLLGLGSEVWGYSLPPATKPALFNQLGLGSRLNHVEGDVRDAAAVAKAVAAAQPHYVFHLAAQPLVRSAHVHPVETWSTNVMGTVNVLEALRTLKRPCAAVIVTTDKVYRGSERAHSEDHPIGAHDPYGASKAAVELAVDAWRQSFFAVPKSRNQAFPKVAVATARAGNVIGGGDWAKDRLVPDCVRALSKGAPIFVRNPSAVRPWQHVLDPLAGYLMLAAHLRDAVVSRSEARLSELSGAFNFGPAAGSNRLVSDVVTRILTDWPGKWRRATKAGDPVETIILRLDARKAGRILGWRPRWRFAEAVDLTMEWYRGSLSPNKALDFTRRQIAQYTAK